MYAINEAWMFRGSQMKLIF